MREGLKIGVLPREGSNSDESLLKCHNRKTSVSNNNPANMARICSISDVGSYFNSRTERANTSEKGFNYSNKT
jgi:hypothetical protein